jgi:predicted Zn finger-like uncharacterized protein
MSGMFTTCPNCKLHLAVTPLDLRVGQGYVRCGRCDKVFNALLSLAEDVDRDKQSGAVATGTTTVPALEEEQQADALLQMPAAPPPPPPEPEPEPESGLHVMLELEPEPEPEFEPATEITPAPDPATQRSDGEPLLSSEPLDGNLEPGDFDAPDEWSRITPIRSPQVSDVEVIESTATGTFETIVLEGDGFLQTEELVDEEEVEEQIQQIAHQIDDEVNDARRRLADMPDVDVNEMTAEEVILGGSPGEELDADQAVGNAPRTHWGWGVAAGLLMLLLVAQFVHHSRQALVSRAWAERPLRGIYSLFGVNLEPKWDLKAYDLRQLGGEAQPGNAAKIVLRATVQNRATSGQPPPMIRVTLQDRFGNALTTTAVAPQEYLKGPAPSRMSPDTRLDAELVLDDPNKQAVGFELDACLPDGAGQLHCSTDP